MSHMALLISIVLLTASGLAADVPFVFDSSSSGVASYSADQLESMLASSPYLAGVPAVTTPSDNEVLQFPVTGGGSTPGIATEKNAGDLKKALDARVEPDNSRVRDEAVVLALKYPGEKTIEQIASIYDYLKNGDGSKKGWGYVSDPRGIDYFMFANQTLKNGDRANCVGGGDCDDFAILMSALVESVGGTTRIILARNSSIGGHAYTEVYLGNLSEKNNQVEDIIDWLKEKFDTDKIYTHIDTATKDVWLNLDWGPDEKGNTHPGGPFLQGDKHIVLCIRDRYEKTALKLSEQSQKQTRQSTIHITSQTVSEQNVTLSGIRHFYAIDVPFVFDSSSSGVADYSADQFEKMRASSPDLVGVPLISESYDNEVLEFPVVSGDSTRAAATGKSIGELKRIVNSRVEPDIVQEQAIGIAGKYSGDYTIEQVCAIYSDLKEDWHYVPDPRGVDYFSYANASLKVGEKSNCIGAGDCDDFAILMAALVESIRGTTRIVLARNNTTGGHAFTEVYIGQLDVQDNRVELIINWLKDKFDTDKIYTHIDTDSKDVWLNLDWGMDEEGNTHPGGPFFQGDRHIVIRINSNTTKTTPSIPEKPNKKPRLISLTPDKNSPLECGNSVNWTAEAKDAEKDPIMYRFFLNDDPVTIWSEKNLWVWNTTEYDIDDNRVEVRIRDTKHSGPDGFDSRKVANFTVTKPTLRPADFAITEQLKQEPQASTNQDTVPAQSSFQPGTSVTQSIPQNSPTSEIIEAEHWYTEGRALDDQLKYEEAIKAYDEAIRLNPSLVKAWNDKGIALRNLHKYYDAIECLDESIRLNPNNGETWYNKGLALNSLGRITEKEAAFEKAKELGWDAWTYAHKFEEIYMGKGKPVRLDNYAAH